MFQPGTDALICADVDGKVSVDHYVADQGYGRPTKTTPVSTAYCKKLCDLHRAACLCLPIIASDSCLI